MTPNARPIAFQQVVPELCRVVIEYYRVTNLLALLLALEGCEMCNSLSKRGLELEARVGIEPTNRFRVWNWRFSSVNNINNIIEMDIS